MRPSKILLASIFITAAILIVIGGITSLAFARKAADPAVSEAAEPMNPQREEAYNQLIEQANQQLDQANAQLQALQGQVDQFQQKDAGAAQPAAAVTQEQAVEVARQVAGEGQVVVSGPELVSFEGVSAYEVVFNQGSIYVDAQSGIVLFNGTVPQTISADKAAEVAAEYLHLTGILQVDQVTIGDQPRYRVIFSDGTMVWMDLSGQIVDIQYKVTNIASSNQQASSGSGGGASTTTTSSHYEDDHEDDHGSDD